MLLAFYQRYGIIKFGHYFPLFDLFLCLLPTSRIKKVGRSVGTGLSAWPKPNLLHFVLSYFSKGQIKRFGGPVNTPEPLVLALT